MVLSFFAFFPKFKSESETDVQASSRNKDFALIRNYLEQEAIVTTVIRPGKRGRVRFQATIWFAVCPYSTILLPETAVLVLGRHSATTLIVQPLPSTPAQFLRSIDAA